MVFFPPTFELSNTKGCSDWLIATREYQSSDWLVKPPDNFAGVGLHFLSAQSVADAQIEQSCASLLDQRLAKHNEDYVDHHGLPECNEIWVQLYISQPMLSLGKYKTSLRSYLLILSIKPALVLYIPGIVYKSLVEYTMYSDNRSWAHNGRASTSESLMARLAHISNIQNNHPSWSSRKADGLQSWEAWASELDSSAGRNFVLNSIKRQTKAINAFAFKSCAGGLTHRNGSFELMAVDYTLDASGRVWLHEFNVAAAIDSGGPNFKPPWKQEAEWRMATDAVDLAMKTFHEQRQGRNGTISLAAQLKESIANTNWEVAYAEYDDGTVEYDAVLELTESEKLLLDGSAYADFNSLVLRKHDPDDVLESYVPQGVASTLRGWYVSMYAKKKE